MFNDLCLGWDGWGIICEDDVTKVLYIPNSVIDLNISSCRYLILNLKLLNGIIVASVGEHVFGICPQ